MSKLYAGVSRVDISTGKIKVNDPLYAKILILKNEKNIYAVISLDYVSMGGGISELSDDFFPSLKEKISALGIDCILCGVTHTHTHFPMCDEEKTVKEKIICAVKETLKNLQPVSVGSGTGKNNTFLINRTLKLDDGSYWSVRQAHPCPPDDRIESVPFSDDEIGIIRFDKEDNVPLCVLFTFGCHPLVGYSNNLATANFPGIAEKYIEENTGAMAMMFQSCGGDVTEIDYKNYDKPKNCYNWGISLGQSVVKAFKNIKTKTKTADIKFVEKNISLPLRKDFKKVKETLLKKREELFSKLGGCPLNFKAFLPLYMKYLISPDYPLGYKYEYLKEESEGRCDLKEQDIINRENILKYLDNLKIMEELSKMATTFETLEWHKQRNESLNKDLIETKVVGMKISDVFLISAPVEPVSQTGVKIKAISPFEKTFIIGYSNGFLHYGAPPADYENGGYETIECMLDSSWFNVYIETVKSIIEEVTK